MNLSARGRSRIRGAAMWLLLLELRAPLITLIVAYAISVLGLVLIPGLTPAGSAYHLSFLDAFYLVSFTATTIGFGEIPYPSLLPPSSPEKGPPHTFLISTLS